MLGPLFFQLYINDFSEKLKGAKDTSFVGKFESIKNIPKK